jgi:hypothetical protein
VAALLPVPLARILAKAVLPVLTLARQVVPLLRILRQVVLMVLTPKQVVLLDLTPKQVVLLVLTPKQVVLMAPTPKQVDPLLRILPSQPARTPSRRAGTLTTMPAMTHAHPRQETLTRNRQTLAKQMCPRTTNLEESELFKAPPQNGVSPRPSGHTGARLVFSLFFTSHRTMGRTL